MTDDRRPMTVSPAEVRRLAALARLDLSDAEVSTLAAELGSILEHMDALQRHAHRPQAATDGDVERGAPLRDDRVDFDPLRRPLDQLAPAWEDGFFVLPRLPALDPRGGQDDG